MKQFEVSGQKLGKERIIRQTIVAPERIVDHYSVVDGFLVQHGKRVEINGKPVRVLFTHQRKHQEHVMAVELTAIFYFARIPAAIISPTYHLSRWPDQRRLSAGISSRAFIVLRSYSTSSAPMS